MAPAATEHHRAHYFHPCSYHGPPTERTAVQADGQVQLCGVLAVQQGVLRHTQRVDGAEELLAGLGGVAARGREEGQSVLCDKGGQRQACIARRPPGVTLQSSSSCRYPLTLLC